MHFGLTSLIAVALTSATTAAFPESEGKIRILVQSSPLAGSQYYKLDALGWKIKPGEPLDLLREPDNPHDRNAVRVLWQGQPLGYLPRKENRAVAKALDEHEPVYATVERIGSDPDPWKRLRISVFIMF